MFVGELCDLDRHVLLQQKLRKAISFWSARAAAKQPYKCVADSSYALILRRKHIIDIRKIVTWEERGQ
jgi:hypothetical protein